jgi:hypothetical protein
MTKEKEAGQRGKQRGATKKGISGKAEPAACSQSWKAAADSAVHSMSMSLRKRSLLSFLSDSVCKAEMKSREKFSPVCVCLTAQEFPWIFGARHGHGIIP